MTELRRIQKAVTETLIPEARANQHDLPSMEQSLPVALELAYTAFAMKPAYRRAGLVIAERYAARMGLDPDEVVAFAESRIAALIADEEAG